uniref:OTU domain-containing protein n=1 Tax=Brugia timori TaxID=42155 RepID=A0A0R3QS78_9BILA
MSKLEGKLKLGNHQAELILRNKPINLLKEHEYSKWIASQAETEMKTEDITKIKFFRLKLLPEQYSYAEYYYPENEPYRVYFHKVSNQWYVYKSYQRISDLFAIDNFNAKVYYMGVIPNDIMNRGDFYEINDFISTVSVLHGEYNRKLELQHITGGGFRPNLRTMKGRKVLPTFLASHAREQTFISNHKRWVHGRKQMSNYTALQRKVRKTVPFKRCSATRLIAFKNVTVSDLCNELIDYPIWVGFHYYSMRVLNKNGLHIIYDDINYAVQEGDKLRHLRIMPSKYMYKPQATTIFGETKVYSKGQVRIPLDHWPLSDYPPSIESVSGYSTVTKMSTATTSPNSWQNDWKMQPRHDEYDHRLTEATIPDIHVDIETVLSKTMLNHKMDPRTIAACNTNNFFPDILDRHGDMTWLKKAESYINSILTKDNPTDDEKKDLKVLYYAKQRYEQTLSKYDSYQQLTQSTDKSQITNRDAWPLDSDFSNLALVDRADHISIPYVIESFHRYHLKGNKMKILAIGTLIFVILLLMLFALALFVAQNKEDSGYCPSNVIGFDPENPHQVKWMQDLLNIKTPVKYDNSSISTAHFFLLRD